MIDTTIKVPLTIWNKTVQCSRFRSFNNECTLDRRDWTKQMRERGFGRQLEKSYLTPMHGDPVNLKTGAERIASFC